MLKYIFIVNGHPKSGKTTFEDILDDYLPSMKYSSVTNIKRMARLCGYDDNIKSEKDRKFLSDLKKLTTEYSDYAFEGIKQTVQYFHNQDRYRVLFIDIREPEEIERAVKAFGAKTVFIENVKAEPVVSNSSDARVTEYPYDYIVKNNGTLEELRIEVVRFISQVIWDEVG